MGDLVKMVCKSCGQEWSCRTGCGIFHAKLDAVVTLFTDDIQEKIRKQTAGKKFPLFSFGYQPAYCERCHDIVSVPVIKLIEEKVEYIGNCPKCLEQIEKEQLKEKLVCPVCQCHEFDVQREGYWD